MADWKKIIVSGSSAELSSLTLDTALTVPNGGTGVNSLTDGGVLLGSGTGAITALGQATNGQLVIGSTGGDPVLSTLTQGTGVTISNTAGSIEISAVGSGGTVTEVDATGTVNGITLTTTPVNGITTTGTVTLGGALANVTNGQLSSNGTMDVGGVTLELGIGDATPAFDLQDATGLPIVAGTTGTLTTTRGGTGLTSYTTGDIIYASATNTLAKLGIGSTGEILTVSAGGIVEWAAGSSGDISLIQNATNGGIEVTNGSGPTVDLSLNFNDLASATVSVANDSIAFLDATGNVTKKESLADLASAQAGTGLTATNGEFSVDYGSSAGTAVEGDTTITVNGTNNAIDITGTTSQALGSAPSYTIDLSDTIDGDRTFTNDVTIGGDLTVQGTASFQSTQELLVADRFVLFASGSNTTGDGGIVVQQGTQNIGELFTYDSATTRWGLTSSFDATNTSYIPDAFLSAVSLGGTDPDAVNARYKKNGNIFVGTDEEIWIYS